MKIYARKRIFAADTSGSTWYKITKEDLLNSVFFKNNVWADYIVENFDFDEFLDLNELDGSFVDDGQFYFLVSDYRQIEMYGESIEPELARDYYNAKELEDYISDNPTKEIINRITDSDIKWNIIDVNEVAKVLLDDENLSKIATDAEEIGLISL